MRDGGLRAMYSVGELAEMSGLTYKRMRGLLERAGVTYLHVGRWRRVPLSELQKKCGSIWESTTLVNHLRVIEREYQESLKEQTEKSECPQ